MDQIFESHFGGNQSSNGGETEAYCPKCRADTTHVILESYGDEVRRVQCGVCGDIHSFKPPRGRDDESPEPLSVSKRKSMKKLSWLDGVHTYDVGAAVRYSPRTLLQPHQIVVHPTFGVGYVSELFGDNKAELIFRNDLARTLVHGRGETEDDRRGERVPSDEVRQLLGLEMGPSPEEIAAERERRQAEEDAEKRAAAEQRKIIEAQRREEERQRRESERDRKRKEKDDEKRRKEEERERAEGGAAVGRGEVVEESPTLGRVARDHREGLDPAGVVDRDEGELQRDEAAAATREAYDAGP